VRRPAQDEISPVGNRHRRIDQRPVALGEPDFESDPVVLKVLGRHRQHPIAGDFKRLGAMPRHHLTLVLERAIRAIFEGLELLLHALELRIKLVRLVPRQDGSNRDLYGLGTFLRRADPSSR